MADSKKRKAKGEAGAGGTDAKDKKKTLDKELDGEIVLKKVETATVFWHLFDELVDDIGEDDGSFLHNRETLLTAFIENRMFCLKMNETEFMLRNGAVTNGIFAGNKPIVLVSSTTQKYIEMGSDYSLYMLPCFCILVDQKQESDNKVDILWVHSRARRYGFGSKFVNDLNVTRTSRQLDDSKEFWTKVLPSQP